MNLAIKQTPYNDLLYGLFGDAQDKQYAKTGLQLMNKLWEKVKTEEIINLGINVWVYEPEDRMFTGTRVSYDPALVNQPGYLFISMQKYASCIHRGPYHLMGETYRLMKNELKVMNIQVIFPWLEIYGHWTEDESKLETEIIMKIE